MGRTILIIMLRNKLLLLLQVSMAGGDTTRAGEE